MNERHILGLESWPFRSEAEGQSLKELATLSDRAAGIVATTLLENSLDDVLIYAFVNTESSLLKELFSENGPLSTFSSKIRLAFALGLVTAEGRHDLDIVRKVRNSFAHDISGSTFDSTTIRDRCRSLKLVDQVVSFEELNIKLPPDLPFPADYVKFGPGGGFQFPKVDPGVMSDSRTRFFLTINHFVTAMLLRSPRTIAPRPYF